MECIFDHKITLPKCLIKYLFDAFLSTSMIKYLSIVSPYLNQMIKIEYGNQSWFDNFLDNILMCDDLFLLKRYQTKFLTVTDNDFGLLKSQCCRHNSINCLRFLHQHNQIWHDYAWEDCQVYDPLECLKFAYDNGSPPPSTILFNKLSLRCVKYLVSLGYTATPRSVCNMIVQGNIEGLIYLNKIVASRSVSCCLSAARTNQLKCLIFLRENNYPWDEGTCRTAALSNSIECLRYAHENGCPWDSDTCSEAAKGNSYECLKYAHENGCPWESDTCSGAAQVGSLKCLRYAHEGGCRWTVTTCNMAVRYGHFDCLWYAVNNGCSWDNTTYETLVRHHISYEYFKLFDQLGCPRSPEIINLLVGTNCLAELKYAYDHNFPFPPDICLTAIECQSIDCLQFLITHNFEIDLWQCLHMASSHKTSYNKEIILILLSHAKAHPEIW